MNGATALPCVSTIKPPNTHIMISTGNSQYRLRTRMKRHNSNTIDIGIPLPMRPHCPSAGGPHLLTSLHGSGNCLRYRGAELGTMKPTSQAICLEEPEISFDADAAPLFTAASISIFTPAAPCLVVGTGRAGSPRIGHLHHSGTCRFCRIRSHCSQIVCLAKPAMLRKRREVKGGWDGPCRRPS